MSSHESDWMQAANCIVDDPEDTRFIRKPLPGEALIWEGICKQCPVSLQCMEWADENNETGVYLAGEWRE